MKKNKTLLLLALLVLAGLAAYMLLVNRDNRSTLDVEETAFAVQDTASVTRIFLSSKGGENVLLERQSEDKWKVNKKYEAFQPMVNMLLETMHRVEVKRPVSIKARNNVVKDLATTGIKVEVYDKEGLKKTFYVGNPTESNLGTYFIMGGAETPYVVSIPGFEGYLTTRFAAPENEWRSRLIFSSLPSSVQELSVTYPDTPSYNFEIVRQAGKLVVKGVEGASEEVIRDYLGQYGNVHAESIFEETPQRFIDSISLIKPWVVVKLKDADPKRSNQVTIYPSGGSPDRMVAFYGPDNILGTVQAYVFNRLLVTKKHFTNPSVAKASAEQKKQ